MTTSVKLRPERIAISRPETTGSRQNGDFGATLAPCRHKRIGCPVTAWIPGRSERRPDPGTSGQCPGGSSELVIGFPARRRAVRTCGVSRLGQCGPYSGMRGWLREPGWRWPGAGTRPRGGGVGRRLRSGRRYSGSRGRLHWGRVGRGTPGARRLLAAGRFRPAGVGRTLQCPAVLLAYRRARIRRVTSRISARSAVLSAHCQRPMRNRRA